MGCENVFVVTDGACMASSKHQNPSLYSTYMKYFAGEEANLQLFDDELKGDFVGLKKLNGVQQVKDVSIPF
jgi:hypothetical protein